MSPLGSYRVASRAWIFDWGLNRLRFLLVFVFRMIGMHAAHRAQRVILCEGRYFKYPVGSLEKEGHGVYKLTNIDRGGGGGVKFQET